MLRPSGKSKKIFDTLMKGDEMTKKKGKNRKPKRDEGVDAEKVFVGHAYGKVPSMNKASKKK